MTKTFTPPYIQGVNNVDGQIVNSTGTGKVLVWTAGGNDSVLKSFGLTSTDSAAHIVQIWINVGGSSTDRLAGSVAVPANAGNDGSTPVVDVLRSAMNTWLSYDAYGNKVFNAKAGTLIKISVTVAVTAAKEIDAIGDGGDL